MSFERFGMWVFVGIGRFLVIIGILAFYQRLVVEPRVSDALITAVLYGGSLIGFGTVLSKLGRLALGQRPDGK